MPALAHPPPSSVSDPSRKNNWWGWRVGGSLNVMQWDLTVWERGSTRTPLCPIQGTRTWAPFWLLCPHRWPVGDNEMLPYIWDHGRTHTMSPGLGHRLHVCSSVCVTVLPTADRCLFLLVWTRCPRRVQPVQLSCLKECRASADEFFFPQCLI